MKNFSKMLGISIISAVSLLGFATQASTGTVNTGSIITGTTIAYTGSLLTYINAQESAMNTLFTSIYTNVYSTFSKT